MINFPNSHPVWMWLYFGIFAITGMVFFILVIWNLMKIYRLSNGTMRSIARWNMFGYMFLFFGQWFACGIGAPPGNLLSPDLSTHNIAHATLTASLSIFFSVPGWICILVSQYKMMKAAEGSSG